MSFRDYAFGRDSFCVMAKIDFENLGLLGLQDAPICPTIETLAQKGFIQKRFFIASLYPSDQVVGFFVWDGKHHSWSASLQYAVSFSSRKDAEAYIQDHPRIKLYKHSTARIELDYCRPNGAPFGILSHREGYASRSAASIDPFLAANAAKAIYGHILQAPSILIPSTADHRIKRWAPFMLPSVDESGASLMIAASGARSLTFSHRNFLACRVDRPTLVGREEIEESAQQLLAVVQRDYDADSVSVNEFMPLWLIAAEPNVVPIRAKWADDWRWGCEDADPDSRWARRSRVNLEAELMKIKAAHPNQPVFICARASVGYPLNPPQPGGVCRIAIQGSSPFPEMELIGPNHPQYHLALKAWALPLGPSISDFNEAKADA
jgi:hypothetical protein